MGLPDSGDVGASGSSEAGAWWSSGVAGPSEPSRTDPTPSGATGGSLVHLQGAGTTWAPGPAPTVSPDEGGFDGEPGPPAGPADAAWLRDAQPTGPEPAAWHTDPGAAESIDDLGPAGLEPVSWYPEPGAAGSIDDLGPAGLEPVSWYPEPGTAAPADDTGWGAGTAAGTSPQPAGSADSWNAGPATDVDTAWDPSPPGGAPATDDGLFGSGAAVEPSHPTRSGADAPGQMLEPATSSDDIVVNWEPAAADAWDAPVRPEGTPKRQAVLSREARLLLAAIVLVLFVLAAGVQLRDRGVGHPSHWASSAQEMADWVSKTRKLSYEHPVSVVTLGGAEYDSAVANATRPSRSATREALAAQAPMWRALGAVEGTPSTGLDVITAQRPELGAFYDAEHQRVVLRDGADGNDLREGLAGALSIALDDQRADLSSLRSTSIAEDPRFGVVMGTAAAMRSDYVRERAAKDGDKPAPQGADGSSPSGTAEAAGTFLDARRELQTRLGAPFYGLVGDVRGAPAANSLAASPPVSSQQLLLPMAYFDGRGPLVVPQPEVPDGADKLDEGTIGAQTWYLLLAGHRSESTTVADALASADSWSGDAYVAYRRSDGKVCVADVLRGSDESQTALLSGALQEWKDSVPGGDIEVDTRATDHVTVVACDPGASAGRGNPGEYAAAVTAAVTRSRLAAGYYHDGTKIPNGVNGPLFEPHVAWCMGAEAVALAQPDQMEALASRRGDTYRDLTLAAGARCNSNMADQLFVERGD